MYDFAVLSTTANHDVPVPLGFACMNSGVEDGISVEEPVW
jgi:hypothetical protein